MEDGGLLFVIAQVALGLVGFGALLISLQPRPISTWAMPDQVRFWSFLRMGLEVIFFSLLPMVVYKVTLDSQTSIKFSGGLLLIVVSTHVIEAARAGRNLLSKGLPSVSRIIFTISMTVLFVCEVLLVGVVLGRFWVPLSGQYTLVVFILLFLTALTFVRLLQFVGERDEP